MIDQLLDTMKKPARDVTTYGLITAGALSLLYYAGNFGGGFLPVLSVLLMLVIQVGLLVVVPTLLLMKKEAPAKTVFSFLVIYWMIRAIFGCLSDGGYATKGMGGVLISLGVFRFLTAIALLGVVALYVLALIKKEVMFEKFAFALFACTYLLFVLCFALRAAAYGKYADWNDYIELVRAYLIMPPVVLFAALYFFPPKGVAPVVKTVEEPAAEPAPEEPAVEEPAAEPATEEPAAEEPAVEEVVDAPADPDNQ